MSNEERLLYSCLNKTNFQKELPAILEYLNSCYYNIIEVNKGTSFKVQESQFVEFIIEKGIEHYYSSKLKLYFDLEEYDDEPVNEVKKEKE